ncbi:MAG: SDR family NAD(P)-dependent oxidoreductase [Gemmatimonadota bacterium]
MELSRKVAMISGASRGLGAGLARRFAEEGASLSLCALGEQRLRNVAEAVRGAGARCVTIAADVSAELDVDRWLRVTLEEFGKLDVLVNNASLLGERERIESYPPAEWRRVLEVNLTGAFLCARAAIPPLRETHGSIINVSSGVGDHGRLLWGAYSVSKNGLEALSQILAEELREDGIRVNAVDPGAMRTEMRAAAYPSEDPAALPEPYEITDVFVYLASDRSRDVTGQRFRAREYSASRAGER